MVANKKAMLKKSDFFMVAKFLVEAAITLRTVDFSMGVCS
jgi:hypothetical protein